jgi:hypothetical protein
MYYCSNCGGVLAGATSKCSHCGAVLKAGGTGSAGDRLAKARQHKWLVDAPRRREHREHKEQAAWQHASRHTKGALETLQQLCGMMRVLTDDYHLKSVGERLAWLSMDPATRRGYVAPSWEPGSYADKHRPDPNTPGMATLHAIAEELWGWREEHWDDLVQQTLAPSDVRAAELAGHGLYLSTTDPQENMQYLAAVLQLERRSRRQVTVKGRVIAFVVSPWLWRTAFALAGIAIVVSLVGFGGSLWAWLALPAAAVAGVVLAMLLAIALRRVRRTVASHPLKVRHPAGV